LFYAFVRCSSVILPLDPDGNPVIRPRPGLNTAISFITNTNLQDYSGESGCYLLYTIAEITLHFVSAATGLAAMMVAFKAMKDKANRDKLATFGTSL